MNEMTKEQQENLRAHVQKNIGLLNAVVQHEISERREIKKNLAEFRNALDEREKILDIALSEKHSKDSAALDEQFNRLEKLINNELTK